MSSLVKYTIINHIEYLIVKLGIDPNDFDETQEIINIINVDIQSLRKKIKLSTIEYPQAQ